MPAEPRFDLDYKYGRQGELQVADFLNWLASGNGRVEVKRKRILDFELYIETECDKGRTGYFEPSGINVSEAEAYAFVVADTGISLVIPTQLLKKAIRHRSARPKEERDGSCPTRGFLVNLAAVMAVAKETGVLT